MPLVWVTGVSGAGKSTVCEVLKVRGEVAVDTDWEGYNHWVDRETREVVVDPPDPVPAGWLDRYGWEISRELVEDLAARSRDRDAYLFGGVENEAEVVDLFELVVCLVIDDETVRRRLATRIGNSFGKHPEELAASLWHNARIEERYRAMGAVIVDGTLPLEDVVEAVTTARRTRRPSRPARTRPTLPS
ncbi:AAA family ATPase [Lentzea sp. NPDC003310]|uniref:AAA family ATPase n=1 Tax=Lentzea sp. NPDC003310 TaxID=3154447 RepID=UPI00339DEB51